MKPLLFVCAAMLLTAVGCESTASGAIPDMRDAALEIVTAATFKSGTPSPVTPDTKVPRAECKECNGTGTITHGDGHKTPCVKCYVASSVCQCGENCQCDNCPSDCLGELVVLADGPKLEAFKGQTLPLLLAANVTAKSPNSANCTNGQCELETKCSGGACKTPSGSGSCDKGECHGSGGDCGSCGSGGGERMEYHRGKPVRNVARAAVKIVAKLRPRNWVGGRRFRGCRR